MKINMLFGEFGGNTENQFIMRKVMFSWLAMFLAAVLCAGVVSCKDDDDDKSSDSGSLLGNWRYYPDGGNYYTDLTFFEGGRGLEREYNGNGVLSDSYDFSWKKEKNTLTFIYDDDDIEETIHYTIVSLTSDVLVLMEEDGDSKTYRRP